MCGRLQPAAWSFYIFSAGETPAPQTRQSTASIVVQASSLQRQAPACRLVTTESPQWERGSGVRTSVTYSAIIA